MTLNRRAEILNFTADHDCWVIEDDYDNEFRFDDRPLSSLYSMDQGHRTFYLGTFNKVLTSTLRVGYIIVPPQLMEPFTQAYSVLGNESLLLTQAALAEFMTEGHLGKHIRRMRKVYTERRHALMSALNSHFNNPDSLKRREAGGMHLVLDIEGPASDQQLRQQANHQGLGGRALTDLRMGSSNRQGLVLGFTAAPVPYLQQGAETIARIVRENNCQVL
ncbi:MAG: hypothetical protein CMF31_06200 [Kordiimonas sp.]|nr:hypothetical protein [Kordiimonas sp.]|tara:strand:- start:195 stop:851 length:657 start_codon:yes stop_codon:yes gene_type:complete